MRRTLAIFLAGAVLALAAAAAGFFVSARLAPERLRAEAERLLSEQVGPVEIASVRPAFAWGLALEARELRTETGAGGSSLGAERAILTVGFRSLLRGRPQLRRLAVHGLWARVARDAEGRWWPEVLDRVLERGRGATDPEQEDTADAEEDPGVQAARWLRRLLPGGPNPPRILVERARISVVELDEHGAQARALSLEQVALELWRPALQREVHLSGEGRLVEAGIDRGGFEIWGLLPGRAPLRLELALSHVDLAPFSPWLARAALVPGARLGLAGRTSGYLSWTPVEGEQRVETELLLFGLEWEARLAEGREPTRLALASARAALTLELGAERARASTLEVEAGAFRLGGTATVDLPIDDRSLLSFQLHGGPLPLAALHSLFETTRAGSATADVGSIVDGTIPRIELRSAGARLAAWGAFLDDPLGAWPRGLALRTEVRDGAWQPAAGEPIRDIDAHVHIAGDRLELSDATASLGSRPLPALELRVDGMGVLARALREAEPARPVPPLPGRFALHEWVESQRKPGRDPSWTRLDLTAEWIEHPAIGGRLERVIAHLEPRSPGVAVELEEAWWNGVRVSGRGEIGGAGPGRLELEVHAVGGEHTPRPRSADDPWAWAWLDASLRRAGPFDARRFRGRVAARGTLLESQDAELWLSPRGSATGRLVLDLGQRHFVETEASFQVENASVSATMRAIQLEPDVATGTLTLATDLRGRLVPGVPLLGELAGPATLHARDGEIRQRLPLALAIAAASDTLNPFRSRDSLPYEGIDAELHLERGMLSADSVSILGPSIRMVGTGSADVVLEPHRMEAVVGLFFFRALDQMISKFPLLNTFFLGSDENLVSAYFSLTGPWAEPKADLIAGKSLAEGPASFVLEGVPAFVRGSLSRLRNLFVLRRPDDAEEGGAPEATP